VQPNDNFYAEDETPEQREQAWNEGEPVLVIPGGNPFDSERENTIRDYDGPVGDPFLVIWDDGSMSTKGGEWVSDAIDLADCDYGEGVRKILALDEHGVLRKIHIGKQVRYNSDFDSVCYATAPIMAGCRRVGTVHFTDH
jgi:hypothetical protein